MTVPKKIFFSNPIAQFQACKAEILEAISQVCMNGPYVLGHEVASFEKEFSEFHDIAHTVGLASGTDALILSMKALGIGAGDEVITVAHTALATVSAILNVGASPVLVDVDDYFTIDVSQVEKAITPRTKAIIPVHIYGQPCDMDPILDIAKTYKLLVIEDCAQAHAATYKDRLVGTIGDIGCFSFYPTKNLGAIGDGGAIITNNKSLAERISRMRQYGWNEDRVATDIGTVSRLDEIQAAILRVKLKYLKRDTHKRQEIADCYDKALSKAGLILPKRKPNTTHAFHLYVVQAENRDNVRQKLSLSDIECGIHYPLPVHHQPAYMNKVKVAEGGLPKTEHYAKTVLSLPIYPELCSDIPKKFEELLS